MAACSGEESIFIFKLSTQTSQTSQQQPEQQQQVPPGQQPDSADGRSAGKADGYEGSGASPTSTWLLSSVSREQPALSPTELLTRPHPRAAPEQVIFSQLACLRRGDVLGAASFNMAGKNLMVSGGSMAYN